MQVSQKEMLEYFSPEIEKRGKSYQKTILVVAKKAEQGKEIVTKTSDGAETKNTAKEGDFLVENQTSTQEQYFVDKVVFERKYEIHENLGNGWASYKPKVITRALEIQKQDLSIFDQEKEVAFEAPWGEEMIFKAGDYLVCPKNMSEIYRIAKKEFEETYQEIKVPE